VDDARKHLEARLTRDREATVRLCQDLVRIPTETPPGDTREIVRHVAAYLEQRHVPHEVVAYEPTMPNIVGSVTGDGAGRHLVLNAHLDVFPAGDPSLWRDGPFSGAVRDGKLYGRGITDMKVGAAASLLTYVYLAEARDAWKGRLTLTLVSDEERFGPHGARALLEHRTDVLGDCLLNGEPSTPGLVRFGERGLVWLAIRTAAAGGHGAYGHHNAIREMSAIVQELDALTAIEARTPPDVREPIERARALLNGYLGPRATDLVMSVTVNLGRIEGGIRVNMAAASCRAEVDIRCPIGLSTQTIVDRVEEIVRRHPNASIEIMHRYEPNYSDPHHPMVGIVQRNAERLRGIRPLPGVSLGCTDCRLWRYQGVPAIVYGPTPYGMGAADEYVTMDDLFATIGVHVLSAFDYLTETQG
jgi:succinyl-diaminopimelate desuccinylase